MFFRKWHWVLGLLIAVSACHRPAYTTLSSAKLEHFDSSYHTEDQTINDLIAPYKNQIDSQMNTVVGFCEAEMIKQRPESVLGNVVSDMLITYTQEHLNETVDLCIMNFGGLRSPLPKGPVTKGKVFELMPFDNTLVLLKLPAESMGQLATHIARQGGEPIGSPHGVKLSKTGNQGYTFIFNTRDNGNDVWVLTSNYLADGGDGFSVYSQALERKETNVLIRDALIMYLSEHTSESNPLSGKVENRIELQ